MAIDETKRKVLGWSLGISALAGTLGGLGLGVKKSFDPLPSVLEAGVVSVDLSALTLNKPTTIQFRGKPIFIIKKDNMNFVNEKRDVKIGDYFYSIMIGSCTHLGCIPAWKQEKFVCACHGGQFDSSGINTFGPPPKPLVIPAFKIQNSNIVLGEVGPEYTKLVNS
ncbi:MAG: Ubiquinol-cytochrome C reductase iron-sulfur subunit (EC [uncultured Campylobacterales bacterium]|uniref:Ubiquinol-cytochrome C reductase iron-sulfur subunit (EC) n=1 Tax=uncultured Campylobacterales bacterium TaxID=352960 RepID=A0A6S6SC94_9BACT|nr:MAG: Ubiquinol-cytochrome C reductase iron-sulfur subunit (EC [uncultured Campylobacterales bacterium]